MKILLVNTRHFRGGGDSTYTFNLADLLRSQGHEVAFFAMQDSRNLPDPNADLFVGHIDFRELNRHRNPITGLQVLSRAIYSQEARRRFSRLVERFHPDIVHLQNIHAHITPSVIFEAKRRGLPVVWTLHDYKLVCPNSHFLIDTTGEICEACGKVSYYEPLLKRCKKNSRLASGMAALEAVCHRLMGVREYVAAFLAPSMFLSGKIIEHGFPPHKVHHLPYFLPSEAFHSRSKDQGYILFLGKLEPLKGIHPLLQACRRAPEIKVILAGRIEEPLANQLSTTMPSNVQYVGLKHGEELLHLLQNARAVVLPSLWYENQPFVILEAFACSKPVIASELGGMTELLSNEEHGLLVSPGDADALAEAMRWMVAHTAETTKMGQNAQQYALNHHGPRQHYEQLMSLYTQSK
jgi:glycosyltransferase involved in cell wall biosynthesis